MYKWIFGILISLSPLAAWGQGTRYDNIAWSPRGPVPFASVAVCTQPANTTSTPCTPLASLFTDLTLATPAPNPLTSDILGNFHFYAAPGTYTVMIYGSNVAVPYVLPDQVTNISVSNILNLNNAWTGNQTFAGSSAFNGALIGLGTNTLSNLNSTVYMGSTAYPLTDAGFTSATSATPSGGTLRITSGQMVSLTAPHILTNPITIQCDPGAGFSYPAAGGGAGAYIQLNGIGSVLDGCNLTGQGASTTQQALIINANSVRVTHNVITNFGNTGGNGTVEVSSGDALKISDNVLSNNVDFDIYVNNATASQVVQGLDISHNYAASIILHSSASGAQISHFTVGHNILTAASNIEYCVEVENLGSAAASAWGVIDHNICELTQNGGNGGFSISGSQISLDTNTLNSNGKTFTISAIEAVVCGDCTITGNILNIGTGGEGISADRMNNGTITGNQVIGFGTGGSDYGIHLFVANTTSPNASNNLVYGNYVTFPAAGAGAGIWQQCNASGAACSGNFYYGNSIFSDAHAGSRGIVFENDTGTSVNESLGTNSFISPATTVTFGAGVTFKKITQGGTKALATGTGSVTFPAAYDTGLAPFCNATDSTAAAAVAASATSTVLTLTGTGTDVLTWRCSVE